MFWPVIITVISVLVVESIVVAVIVRKKHLDRWLPSYLFGMDSCPRLNQPVPRPEAIESGTAAELLESPKTRADAPCGEEDRKSVV